MKTPTSHLAAHRAAHDAASTLWIVLLTAASSATTLALGCATPFAALAALAAAHMRRGDAVRLMAAAWLASQIVGFALLDYPHDAETFGWAATLAAAAVAAALGSRAAFDRTAGRPDLLRLAIAYLTAFAAFKAVVLLASLALGGTASLAAPALLARQFLRDGAILVALLALYHALTALGLPRASGRAVTA